VRACWSRTSTKRAVAVLLASDEVPYMTGAELHVDGGLLAGSAATPTER
jgi:hypothetical protein